MFNTTDSVPRGDGALSKLRRRLKTRIPLKRSGIYKLNARLSDLVELASLDVYRRYLAEEGPLTPEGKKLPTTYPLTGGLYTKTESGRAVGAAIAARLPPERLLEGKRRQRWSRKKKPGEGPGGITKEELEPMGSRLRGKPMFTEHFVHAGTKHRIMMHPVTKELVPAGELRSRKEAVPVQTEEELRALKQRTGRGKLKTEKIKYPLYTKGYGRFDKESYIRAKYGLAPGEPFHSAAGTIIPRLSAVHKDKIAMLRAELAQKHIPEAEINVHAKQMSEKFIKDYEAELGEAYRMPGSVQKYMKPGGGVGRRYVEKMHPQELKQFVGQKLTKEIERHRQHAAGELRGIREIVQSRRRHLGQFVHTPPAHVLDYYRTVLEGDPQKKVKGLIERHQERYDEMLSKHESRIHATLKKGIEAEDPSLHPAESSRQAEELQALISHRNISPPARPLTPEEHGKLSHYMTLGSGHHVGPQKINAMKQGADKLRDLATGAGRAEIRKRILSGGELWKNDPFQPIKKFPWGKVGIGGLAAGAAVGAGVFTARGIARRRRERQAAMQPVAMNSKVPEIWFQKIPLSRMKKLVLSIKKRAVRQMAREGRLKNVTPLEDVRSNIKMREKTLREAEQAHAARDTQQRQWQREIDEERERLKLIPIKRERAIRKEAYAQGAAEERGAFAGRLEKLEGQHEAARAQERLRHGRTLGWAIGGTAVGAGAAGGGVGYILGRRKERQFRAMSKLIQFARRQQEVPPRPNQRIIVAKDRYLKQIRQRDIASAIADYGRSAGAGAALGYLLRRKMPVGRALKIGAVGGLGAEAVTRAYTKTTKDPFGERPWTSKEIDKAPWEAGAVATGAILTKRKLPRVWKAIKEFAAKDPNDVPAWHDITTGAVEGGLGVLATDRLIRKFAPEGTAVGRKLAIGAAVGGAATGGIGFALNKLVRKKVQERRQRKAQAVVNNLQSRIRLIRFQDEAGEEYRRWVEGTTAKKRQQALKVPGFGRPRSVKPFVKEAKSWVGYPGHPGRIGRLLRDRKLPRTETGMVLDPRGRERKPEWQKPWVASLATSAVIGSGYLAWRGFPKHGIPGVRNWALKTPIAQNIAGTVLGVKKEAAGAWKKPPGEQTVADMIKTAQAFPGQNVIDLKKAGGAAIKKEAVLKQERAELLAQKQLEHVAEPHAKKPEITQFPGKRKPNPPKNFSSRLREIRFQDPWGISHRSTRTAVVYAPGGRPRQRREKEWWERKANQQKLWTAGILGGATLAAGGASYVYRGKLRRLLPKAKKYQIEAVPDFVAARPAHPGFQSKSAVIRFADKEKDYAKPIAGVTGAGGFVAGGLYRGRKLQPGEDLTGRRVTRPHSVHPLLQHEGIGIGGGKIAHLHHTPESEKGTAVVKAVTPEEFARGTQIKVLDKSPSQIAAERARAAVGETQPYSLLYRNCQRFGGCARIGTTRLIPRQLRTALVTGAVAAGAGYGGTKLFKRKNHEFAARDQDRPGAWRRPVGITATAAGIGATGLGLSLAPTAHALGRIARTEWLRGSKSKLAGLARRVASPDDPNRAGKMVFNYIDAAHKFMNRGVRGRVIGAGLMQARHNPHGAIGHMVRQVPGLDEPFHIEHYQRFRAGPLQAMGHWDLEHGLLQEKKYAAGELTATGLAKRQARMKLGREKTWAEINHQMHNVGMNERDALKHVTHNTTDPDVRNYFKSLALINIKPAGRYAKLSGYGSAGLTTAGVGTIAAANWPRDREPQRPVRRTRR